MAETQEEIGHQTFQCRCGFVWEEQIQEEPVYMGEVHECPTCKRMFEVDNSNCITFNTVLEPIKTPKRRNLRSTREWLKLK